MSLTSLQFLAACLLLSAVFFYLPGLRFRQWVLTFCNAGFLYLLVPNAASWLALAVFLLSGFGMALLLNRWRSGALFSAYVVALVAAFLVLRKYDVITAILPQSIGAHSLTIVGLSYMLFRQIHYLVDTMQGQVEQVSLTRYANYQLGLFTLLSGPIQRYQDFQAQWDGLAPALTDGYALRAAYFRLLMGVVKMTVLATAFMSLYQRSADALIAAGEGVFVLGRGAAIGHFLSIFYFYPVYLYLNFSGYCDIVIAGALLFGMKLPENFDQPYLARNVIDYWTRWHRTLGFWIRDYLFMPMYKGIAERWPQRAEPLAFLCYFVAFFVAGIWHGPTMNFATYGFLQAIGVSAAKLWERHILKRGGRARLKQYLQSRKVRVIAILGTVHFECFSLLFFPVDLHTTIQMFRTIFRAIV